MERFWRAFFCSLLNMMKDALSCPSNMDEKIVLWYWCHHRHIRQKENLYSRSSRETNCN
jgi:hypothetical protein